jgi:hypothetical protein
MGAPSPRVTAGLAAVMLAIGVAVGAAIGPAPNASFAGASRLPLLLPSLLAGAGTRAHPRTTTPAATAPAPSPAPAREAAATPAPAKHRVRTTTAGGQAPRSTETPQTSTSDTPKPTSRTPTGAGGPSALPPIAKVWLIELAGTGFAEAAAQPSAAPYIDTGAVPSGTLLSGWSAVDGSAFANDAALLASSPPQVLETIVQPPCPASSPEGEGAAAAQCATGTPGGLTAADEFAKATVASIAATSGYRENGLIAITFGSIASATATGLPGGAATATLTSQPPAGVLLISPFVSAGGRSSAAFDPTSPRQSLEKLLHR